MSAALGLLLLAACGLQELEPGGTAAAAPEPADTHSLGRDALAGGAPGAGRQPLTAGPEPGAETLPASPWGAPLGGPSEGFDDRARVRIAEAAFDYGTAFEGAQVEHRFRIESVGEAPLVIHGVQSSCGCAVPVLWSVDGAGARTEYERGQALEPGAHLEVDVVFDTRGRPGRQDKPVWLYGNVPGGRIEVELRGSVRAFLVAEPMELELGQVLAGMAAQGSLELASADGSAVRVSVARDALPTGIEIDLVPLSPDGEGRSVRWRADVAVGEQAQPSLLRWPVAFQSDRASSPAEDAPPLAGSAMLVVDILPPVEFSPPHLSFGVLRPGAVHVQHSRLRFNSEELAARYADPEQLVLRVDGEVGTQPAAQFVRTSLERADDGPGFLLEVQVRDLPAGERGRLSGALWLEVTGGSLPPVPITFTGVLTGR